MGFWDFGKSVNINAKLAEARSIRHAVIIDVREPHEYEFGHIPGAVNLPVGQIGLIRETLKDRLIEGRRTETPLYVYCSSGVRSRKAAGILKAMGFWAVEDMGGVNRYTGQFEKGGMPEPPAKTAESPVAEATGDEVSAPAKEICDEAAEALRDGAVTVKTFPNADAAKVYLMSTITAEKDMRRGMLLYTPADQAGGRGHAELILLDE